MTKRDASTDEPAEFRGEFKPPRMGNRHMPIRVGGPGLVELGSAELVVKGYDAQKSYCLPLFLFFAGIAPLIALGVALDVPEWAVESLAGGLTAVFLGFVLRRRGDYEKNDPKELIIPWDKVESVDWSGDDSGMQSDAGEVKILVEDHDPEGMLHFYPEDDAPEFADAVRRAAGLE